MSEAKYNSFLCPILLLDALDDIKKRLPGVNLNIAKVLFLATTYMMEDKYKIEPKLLKVDEKVPTDKVMIRVTPALLKRVKRYEKEYNLSKTDIYTIAMSNFINLLFDTINKIEEISYAKSVDAGFIFVLDADLKKVLESNSVAQRASLIQESFRLQDGSLYHIVNIESLFCLIVESLFDNILLDPKKVYKKLF